MNSNFLSKGSLTENDKGIGEISEQMLHQRAIEIATINGRTGNKPSIADQEQARRDLTGGPEIDYQEALLESAPESQRWNPVPFSTGHRTPSITTDEEDSEGRSNTAALVEEGAREAEHDQMLQAARAQQEEDDA